MRIEAPAIIAHLEQDAPLRALLAGQIDVEMMRFRVSNAVGERLLPDAIDRKIHGLPQTFKIPASRELHGQRRMRVAPAIDTGLQCVDQSQLVQCGWSQMAHQVAGGAIYMISMVRDTCCDGFDTAALTGMRQ